MSGVVWQRELFSVDGVVAKTHKLLWELFC